MPYTICGQTFKSKATLEAEVKKLRNFHSLSTPLSPANQTFVEEVFHQLYPKEEAQKKQLSVGASQIQVIEVMGGRCFRFYLRDGRTEEPSLNLCFKPWLAKPGATIRDAMRYEVYSDSVEYRNTYFSKHTSASNQAPCELSGRQISVEECEVDHYPSSFQTILESFLASKGLTLSQIKTKDPSHGFGAVLEDRKFAQDWKIYHHTQAKFRVLSQEEHKRVTKLNQTNLS